MLHVLTDELCMCVEFVESGWTVDSLLERVANADHGAKVICRLLRTGNQTSGRRQRVFADRATAATFGSATIL